MIFSQMEMWLRCLGGMGIDLGDQVKWASIVHRLNNKLKNVVGNLRSENLIWVLQRRSRLSQVLPKFPQVIYKNSKIWRIEKDMEQFVKMLSILNLNILKLRPVSISLTNSSKMKAAISIFRINQEMKVIVNIWDLSSMILRNYTSMCMWICRT